MNALAKHEPYQGSVYRAFSTAQPTQNLMDDLTDGPEESEVLQRLYYDPSSDPTLPHPERAFAYSVNEYIDEQISVKFTPERWYFSRYSNGKWPVLYSAEAEKTALYESLHHKWKKFYKEELKKYEIPIDLKIVELSLNTDRSIDLVKIPELDAGMLTSVDESGYPYCQDLAKRSIDGGTVLFRAPSARHVGGICVPIFDVKKAVEKDKGHLRYIKVVLHQEFKKNRVFREDSMILLNEI